MKMLKKITKLIVLVLSLFLFNNVYAVDDIEANSYINGNYKVVIEDDANLLSEDEKTKLMDDMLPLTEYGHAIFKSIDKNEYNSTYEYGKKYYYNNFKNEICLYYFWRG